MNLYLNKLDRYFFSPVSWVNLAVCRIIFFGYLLWDAQKFISWINFNLLPDFAYRPVGIFQIIEPDRFSPDIFFLIKVVFIISSFFSLIGFLGPISFFLCFLSFGVVNSIPQNYSTVVYLNIPIIFIALIFSFSKASRFFSVDYFLFHKKNKFEIRSPEYNWPIRAGQIVFVCFFFLSGFYKLSKSGLEWVTSDNFKNVLLCSHFFRGDSVGSFIRDLKLNYWVAQISYLPNLGAAYAMILELLVISALFYRRMAYIVIPSLFLMQVIGFFIIFIDPTFCIVLYIFWINWEYVLNRPILLNLLSKIP